MIVTLVLAALSPDPGAWPGRLDMLDLVRGAGGHGTVIADAGSHRDAEPGESIPLDGCESEVPFEPAAIEFSWSQLDGPRRIEILAPDQPLAAFTAPSSGIYRFRLTTRWHGHEDQAVVTITVE